MRSRSATTASSRRRAWRRAFSVAMAAWLARDDSISTSSTSNPRATREPTIRRPIVSPARWSGASSRATANPGRTNRAAPEAAAAPFRSTASSGPLAAARYASPSAPNATRTATSRPRRRRAWSTMAWRISSRSASAAMATLTRCSARADASRRSRSALRARSSADRRSIRRNATRREAVGKDRDHHDHDHRVEREWEQAVEPAVADELDDGDDDDGDDDAEPADRSHRPSIGPGRAKQDQRTDVAQPEP